MLSPVQVHYLKKALISQELQHEINLLSTKDSLSTFGPPFKENEDTPTHKGAVVDLPLLRFFFANYIKTFPFLKKADEKFWQDKVQVFVNLFVSKHISSSGDRQEVTKRRRLALKVEKHLSLLFNSGIKASNDETVKTATPPIPQKQPSIQPFRPEGNAINGLDVNVVTVRIVWERRHVRQHPHGEFIIKTSRDGQPDVFVARRHGAFKKLREDLHEAFPEVELLPIPGKNKSDDQAQKPISQTASIGSDSSSDDDLNSQTFPREKNRLGLRAFLRSLIANPAIAKSTLLLDFLTADTTVLTADELIDVDRRKALDFRRLEEQTKFRTETSKRAKELEEHLATFKDDLVKRDGLTEVFSIIRSTPELKDLPLHYRKVVEWTRISFAATIFNLFVASDNSSEVFDQLKRLHSLLPYFLLRQVMKISNPVAMTRGFLDLFLAQPFGQRSLFQRIFAMTLNEDIKAMQKDIDTLQAELQEPIMAQKLKDYTMTSPTEQEIIRKEAADDDVDVVIAILRHSQAPTLESISMARIAKARNDSSDPLIEQLQRLLRLYTRQRDKQQMMEVLFEGITADLLRDIVSIFYEPLARVYKAANVADKINDFSAFLDDLIATVNKANSQLITDDAQKTVQLFIDLVERHEQRFYSFVYQVHTHDGGLFTELMAWIQLFLNFLRDGITGRVDMDLVADSAPDKAALLAEVDKVVEWHLEKKKAHEKRMAKRLERGQDDGVPNASAVFDEGSLGISRSELEELQALDSESDGEVEEDWADAVEDLPKQQLTPRPGKHIPAPTLREIPTLVSFFIQQIKADLTAYTTKHGN